jgi:hypothetical protein
MNLSTPEIVEKVFQEYTPKLTQLSNPGTKKEMESSIRDMQSKLMDMLYQQYYSTTSRFMTSIDVDDVLCSSPPRSSIIKAAIMPNTPLK